MSFKVYWYDNEKTIIASVATSSKVSWDEFDGAIKTAWQMASTVPYRVDFCSWEENGPVPMPKGDALGHLKSAVKSKPNNVKLIVSVANNQNIFALAVIGIIARSVIGKALRMASSKEQALSIVAEDRTRG